jgi:sugar phosphate isomerase/epimerase
LALVSSSGLLAPRRGKCYIVIMLQNRVSRRSFLTLSGAASLGWAFAPANGWALPPARKIPVGLELYSVREALANDLMGTVRAVAKMGYEVVEFYSPYFQWTPDYAKKVRALMDDLGIRCNSTHNDSEAFTAEGLKKAAELNQILGAKYIVWASAGDPAGLDGWKGVATKLAEASQTLAPSNMRVGYHNHDVEFRVGLGMPGGQRPMEVIAANTPKDVMLQLDVGHCVEGGGNPVTWIRSNPGRIRSIHCKDFRIGKGSRLQRTEKSGMNEKGENETSASVSFGNGDKAETGFRVLIGEGDVHWGQVVQAAESVGGVEYYLIEQEGSRFSELETAERCLANWKRVRVQF